MCIFRENEKWNGTEGDKETERRMNIWGFEIRGIAEQEMNLLKQANRKILSFQTSFQKKFC